MGLRHITVDRIDDPIDIYASDDSRIFASILGAEGIHNIGNCMKCEAIGSNQFRISDGVASVQGHIAIIDPGDEEVLTADIGVSGYNRIDLIVLDFNTDGQNDEITLQVIKGTQASTPVVPSYVSQDLTKGGTHRQVPLWKINFEGALIKGVERATPVIDSLQSLTDLINDVLTGTKTVGKANKAFGTDGMDVGSPENQDRYLNFHTKDGAYYRLYAYDGGLYIRKYKADGTAIRTALSISKDGISTVDNATNASHAPEGFDLGSDEAPNRMLKFFTGHDGSYFRIHAWYSGDPVKDCLWLELVDKDGNIIGTPLKIIDGEGTIDKALAVPWSGVFDKPETYPPSSHNHDDRYFTETEITNNYVSKAASGLLVRPATSSNILSFASDGIKNGLVEVANTYSGDTANCPYDPFMGLKIQYNISASISFVLLYEAAPHPGNVWMRVYNNNWRDWVCVSGRRQLWTGSIGEGNQVELNASPNTYHCTLQ